MNYQHPLFLAFACYFYVFISRSFSANLGDVDPFFNPNLNGGVGVMVAQPDGRILIGGSFTQVDGTNRPGFARLHPDGTLDASFNPSEWPGGFPGSLALRPDGRIIAGKSFGRVLELGPDGSLLSGGPSITENIEEQDPDYQPSVWQVLLQPDGKVLFTGYFTSVDGISRTGLARLNTDGTLDTAFNPVIEYSEEISPPHVALQRDGKILVGGDFWRVNGELRNRFVRLNDDGTIDNAFAREGEAVEEVYEYFIPMDDGRIWLGNGMRLKPDGTLDSFLLPAIERAEPIVPQGDGQLLIVGGPTLWRMDTNGTRDTNFYATVNHERLPYISAVATQADGKILIAGGFTQVNGVARNGFARLIGQRANEVAVGSIRQHGEHVGFDLKSVRPTNVTVEASTNLIHWVPLQTLTVGTEPVQFRDTNRIHFPTRIYRTSWER